MHCENVVVRSRGLWYTVCNRERHEMSYNNNCATFCDGGMRGCRHSYADRALHSVFCPPIGDGARGAGQLSRRGARGCRFGESASRVWKERTPSRKKDGWFLDSIYIYITHVSEYRLKFTSNTSRQKKGLCRNGIESLKK